MIKVIMMCGICGSGKTTYAKQKEKEGYVRLSIDEEMWKTYGRKGIDYPNEQYEKLSEIVEMALQKELLSLIQQGKHVVLDFSFWNKANRVYYKRLIEKAGGTPELVYMKDETSFEILGETQDDAIGEAFDKVARVLGLGYPGGPKIDKLAKEGKPVYELAKPKTQGRYDFSFSGLKSSVLQFTKRMERQGKTFDMADLACSFQECALDEIFSRVRAVLDDHKDIRHFVVGGGVSANSRLREKVEELRNEYPEVEFTVPPMYCCTDNASMIGVAGTIAYLSGRRGDASLTADSSLEIQ